MQLLKAYFGPFSTSKSKFLLAGQLVLSAFVLAGFLLLARAAGSAIAAFQAPPPAAYAPAHNAGGYDAPPPDRLWPLYPGFRASGVRGMTINGIEILSEDGEVNSAADDVLSYYAQQMTARGWRDVSEESFGLSEGLQAAGLDPELDRQFFKTYDEILESNRAFQRGLWTVVLALSPGSRPWNMRMRISAYNTPPTQEIIEALGMAPNKESAGQDGLVLKAEETLGGSRIQTQVYESPLPPADFYLRTLDSLRASRWSPVFLSPTQDPQARLFAVFQKDGRYTYVIVSPASSGRGASAVVSEMDEGPAAMPEWRVL